MKGLIPLVFLLLIIGSCQPQKKQNTRKELVYHKNDTDWYARQKGITKYLIQIDRGKPEAAIEQANKQGQDAEACFVKAVAFAKMEMKDSAMANVYKSIDLGLTIDRYQGLPKMLAPLNQISEFRTFVQNNGNSLVHGPMLGHTTSNTARFWLRTNKSSEVRITLSQSEDFSDAVATDQLQTSMDNGFVAKPEIFGLKANTTYFYKIVLDGKALDKTYSFTTQPKEGEPAEFAIAFGGGAAYIPWHSYMWNTLDSHKLNAMLFMGDNVYIDYPKEFEIQRYCYHRRQSRPNYRTFVSGTPILSIWDDHDFGVNDQFGGPDKDFPEWKPSVLEVFKNQFANPYYGGGKENPGVWYDFQLGDVDFFMLDCRYYRESSSADGNIEDPQMLGPVQLEWLKKKLLASNGTFKVIVSSVPWAYGAKAEMAGRYDTWRGYKKERKEIFDFLAENEIDGVVLLSADRHRSDLWKIERENGYPLYEMESSKLVNTHTHQCMDDPERILCYNQKCSFGKILVNTKTDNPYLTYQIWSIDNEKIAEYTIPLNELK